MFEECAICGKLSFEYSNLENLCHECGKRLKSRFNKVIVNLHMASYIKSKMVEKEVYNG